MMYITANSKGGVGKSTASVIIACLLQQQEKKFRVIELDSSNQSFQFQDSFFLKDNTQTFKIDEKDEAIGDMLFDLMDQNIDYVVDIGGGLDTNIIVEELKTIDVPKKWLIPTTSIKKYLQNASNTFDLIDDPKNTYFILNQYSKIEKLKDEFLYFFGDKNFGIEPVSQNFTKCKNILMIPHNNYFQISEDENKTILDLAMISHSLGEADARTKFMKAAKGQKEIFKKMYQNYRVSLAANDVFKEIENNFKPLFEK